MYRRLTALLCCAACLSATHAGVLQAQDVVAADDLRQLGYYKYWQARVPLRAEEQLNDIHLVDENLYAVTNQTVIYALHADIGTIRWLADLGGVGHRVYRPTHVRSFWGRDLVLVTTTQDLRWIDRATGEELARLKPAAVPAASAVSDGVRVYFPGMDSMLYCYEFFQHGERVEVFQKWRILTGDISTSVPVLWGGALFFASRDGRIRACNSYDKGRLWVFNSKTQITGDIFVDSTGVYFGGLNHYIYKLDVTTGQAEWRLKVPGMVRRGPQLIGDLLIQLVDGHGVFVLRADEEGKLAWHASAVTEFLCASDEQAYFLSDYGDILSFELQTGAAKAQVYAPGIDLMASNPVSQAMYLGGRDGRVLCAQDKSVPYLRFEQIEARIQPEGAASEAAAAERGSETAGEERPDLTELLRSKSKVPPLGR